MARLAVCKPDREGNLAMLEIDGSRLGARCNGRRRWLDCVTLRLLPTKTIEVSYENGVFRAFEALNLPECRSTRVQDADAEDDHALHAKVC